MEIPATFYMKLGDTEVVTAEANSLIKNFIRGKWPVLAKKRGLKYRVSYDYAKKVFNAVLIGKQAPLSYCCKRSVIFTFSNKNTTDPECGKVLCSNPFCI